MSIPEGKLPAGNVIPMDVFDRRRERLKLLLSEMTQAELARRSGVAASYISRSLRLPGDDGYKSIGEVTARKLEAGARKPEGWLDALGGGFERDMPQLQPAPIGERRIPLISHVQAGNWSEATDPHAMGDGFDFLLTDQELSESAFALEIKGDSMLPEFKPGDRVIIDPEVHPQPGDFVVAKNGEEEATFKKYRPRGVNEFGGDVFELVPLNEDYATMRSDVQPIRIVGTMVEHRKYRRR